MRINRSLGAACILAAGAFISVTTLSADEKGPDSFSVRPREHGTVVHSEAHNGPTGGAVVTGNGINYNGGPIMSPVNLYYILYGNWAGTGGAGNSDPTGPGILETWGQNFAPSPYFNINTTYGDSTGANVPNLVTYKGVYTDSGSLGASLNDSSIAQLASNAINSGQLGTAGVADPNGMYMVLTAPGIAETTGFLSSYCGWHWSGSFVNGAITPGTIYSGTPVVKFAFIGNAAGPSFGSCAIQSTSPNGDAGADAMISVMAHELSEAVSDPEGNAWYASNGEENGDLCAWNFGTTSVLPSGAQWNVSLGGKDYLIQQMWLNAQGGKCVLSYAATPDFSVSISGSPQTIAPGGTSGTYTLTATDLNGFSGTVSWSFPNGLPSGISANPGTLANGNSSGFTLTAALGTTPGTYTIQVTGTSNSLSHSTTATLTVSAPNFSVSVTPPASTSVVQGLTTGTYTATATDLNGFSGVVSWSVTPPGGSGITVNGLTPSGNTATFTLTASSSATLTTDTIVVKGTSGTLVNSANTSVTVTAPTFTVSTKSSAIAVTRPASGSVQASPDQITVGAVGAYSGSVTLSASGGTTGIAVGISGSSTTVKPPYPNSSDSLTITVSSKARKGTRTLTVSGTDTTTKVKKSTNVTLTVQ